MINHVTSLFIYEGLPKYIFLGDTHMIKENNCDGIAVDELLAYNDKHHIKTDVFAEVYFTKSNQRKIKTGDINSPLSLLPYTIPCFTKDKHCYENVKLHYVDIRSVDQGMIVSIDPFDMFRLRYLADNNRVDYRAVIKIIKTIEINYLKLLNLLLHPMNFRNVDMFLSLDKAYSIVFKHINDHAVIREGKKMSRACAALHKLGKFDISLVGKIMTFIYQKARNYMAGVDFQEEIDLIGLSEHTHDKSLMNHAITNVDNKLLQLGALVMDAYTLARLFYTVHHGTDEVIVYAGTSHISLYVDFFKTLELTPQIEIVNEDQCLYDDQLSNYLDINKYLNDS